MKRDREVQPTFDSRERPDPYTLETIVAMRTGYRLFSESRTIPDPFVTHRVTLGLWHRICAVFDGMIVEVRVSAPPDICEDVMELNDDYRGQPGSPRRNRVDAEFNDALHRFAAPKDPE